MPQRRAPRRSRKPRTGAAPAVQPDAASPRAIAAEFRSLLHAGARLLPAGAAKADPEDLVRRYGPRHRLSLFGIDFYFTDFRFDEALNYFVGYVAPVPTSNRSTLRIYPRIFYKDISLIWRVASHFVHSENEYWIGKGDVRVERIDGEDFECSAEDTTNLPYELQAAMDLICRRRRARRDDAGVALVLRQAPEGRIAPYADFAGPRKRAHASTAINRGRRVAYFARKSDPESLRFVRGYEPDFERGLVETSVSASRLYEGELQKHRILSTNRLIQYQFVASPTHCWVNPPQALTEELTTYGVRMIDVPADDYVFVPGYEYHFIDNSVDPPQLHSQIPPGFAGEPSELDPSRANAAAWIEALPVVRSFRRAVLGQ